MNDDANKYELTEFSKENPFNIPENYFDNFYLKLQTKISKKESFYKKYLIIFKPQFSYFLFAILFSVFTYTSYKIIYKDHTIISLKINKEIYYSEINNINENEITDMLCEDNAKPVNSKIYDDEIIHYLVDNNIDNTEIINEY